MDIKEFVRDVLIELDQAVMEAGKETAREVRLTSGNAEHQTVQFDMAVAVEQSKENKGKAGVKVLELFEGGGELSSRSTNATVTRVKFGVNFDTQTREEAEKSRQRVQAHNSSLPHAHF